MTIKNKFITRFAPSPTGFLHIGGARTALFNRLLASANNGEMKLRIEDTDRERSTPQAVEAILEGMKWLGIEWDGEIISQFDNRKRHGEIAQELLINGHAYKDEGAVRIKIPKDKKTIVNDKIQGQVEFDNNELEDFVLLRSDNTPTYMLAVVVDDHDMGVSHIVRGDDHLTNAAKQIVIYQAMKWEIPIMAHISLIHGEDGKKLSKRHGALGVGEYQKFGMMPEALCNYLVRLGWSHGDQEYFTKNELEKVFSLEGVGKSASRLDVAKMENVNGHFIRNSNDEELIKHIKNCLGVMENGEWYQQQWSEKVEGRLMLALEELKEKESNLIKIIEDVKFLFAEEPLPKNDKGQKVVENAKVVLNEFAKEIEAMSQWSLKAIEERVNEFLKEKEIKLGMLAQPLRIALTGGGNRLGIFYVVYALGKDEVVRRLMQDR